MAASLPSADRRRVYLDWLRGAAVLLMIEVHLFDSWTGLPDRATPSFGTAMIVGGMGTALFLLLAGIVAGLSAGSTLRRTGDRRAAAMAVARRGVEIFGLAFLFRLQAWMLGSSSSQGDLLKVDILNIMGPSIVMTALLWWAVDSHRGRAVLFAACAAATVLTTPALRSAGLHHWPEPVRAYVVPVAGLSQFVFFPWTGLVFAGACIGGLVDGAVASASESRLIRRLVLAGALVSVVAYVGSYLPPLHRSSSFWTTSTSFFLMRLGIMMIAIGVAHWWTSGVAARGGWSPLAVLGRASLFVYWIHVELVYGVFSKPFHHALTLGRTALAYVLFVVLMGSAAWLKEHLSTRLRVAG